MDPSGPYAGPLTTNVFVHAPASSVSERTPSDTESCVPLRATTTTDDDCKKLEDSNRMLSTVFRVLVTACVLVVLVYIALIVYLFASLPALTSQSASQSSASTSCGQGGQDGGVWPDRPDGADGARDGTFCVDKRHMDTLVTSYEKESKDSTIDFVKRLRGFQGYRAQKRTFCFRNLSWVPDMMSKINNKTLRNVEDIEEKQETINKTVSAYSSANSTRRKCDTVAAGDSVRSDRTKSVVGHFFLSSIRPASSSGGNATSYLKWIPGDFKDSVRRGMEVSDQTWKVSIMHTGFYYVYSNVVFKTDANVDHVVVKEKEGEKEEMLLQSKTGLASFLQGVFMLQTGETLSVKATESKLDTDRSQSTYLGLYLIRT